MKHTTRILAFVLTVIVADGLCRAQVQAVTKARHDLKLGFTVGGKVAKVLVKPGDRVEKDQVLLTLDDDEGQAIVDLYKLRAASSLEVQAAEAALRLAEVEEKAIRRAFENDAAKPIEVERAQINTTRASLEVRMAIQRGQETQHQLDQASSRHKQYLLMAPLAGVVDMVTVAEGELVEELKPVLRLVVIDPLWIDASLPTKDTLGIKQGDPAWVQSQLSDNPTEPVKGKIIHLAEIADAASDTRLVRVEVPNPQQLPAGGQVTVSLTRPSATAMATPTDGSTEAR